MDGRRGDPLAVPSEDLLAKGRGARHRPVRRGRGKHLRQPPILGQRGLGVKPAPLKGLSAHPGYGLAPHPLGAGHITIGLSPEQALNHLPDLVHLEPQWLIASPLEKIREGNAPRGPKREPATGRGLFSPRIDWRL